jgi:hypothetical protein
MMLRTIPRRPKRPKAAPRRPARRAASRARHRRTKPDKAAAQREAAAQRKLQALDDSIYQAWNDREIARYSFTHTGVSRHDHEMAAAQRRIEELQAERLRVIRDFYQAQINAGGSFQKYKELYTRELDRARRVYGLAGKKFQGLPGSHTLEGPTPAERRFLLTPD